MRQTAHALPIAWGSAAVFLAERASAAWAAIVGAGLRAARSTGDRGKSRKRIRRADEQIRQSGARPPKTK